MKRITQILKTIGFSAALSASLLFSGPSQAHLGLSYPIPSDKDVLLTFGFPSQNSLSKRINILVWNLHKGANDNFATDFVSLAYQKDIVLSQEMALTPWMRLVFGSFPHYFYVSGTSFFYGKELTRTGVVTSSPVEPSSINYVRTETLEPILNSPKLTLITRYPIRFTTKQLTVVNIHGINFVDVASYRKEMERISEILKNTPSPIIFSGDFNSWNDGRFLVLKEMRQKLKLKEASFFPDYRMKFNKHPLDHFFYTDDLKIIAAKVEDFYQGSDHKPLELIVEYSPQIKLQTKK